MELFDNDQPFLYYGLLTSSTDLDKTAKQTLTEVRQRLKVSRLHANELGVGRLTPVAPRLTRFSRKNDLRFSLLKVAKQDHAVISFFDQVFDSGMNEAVRWVDYFTPLRYLLLLKVAFLFDDSLAQKAWAARRERNPANCASMLVDLCRVLLGKVSNLPDERSREIISGALKWAAEHPTEISYGVGNHDSALQISPNLVGFQQVLYLIAQQSEKRKTRVSAVIVDRQTEFNKAQAELADIYQKLRGHKPDMGPGMPSFDYSSMPEVPPVFVSGDASCGLELVDVTLWIAKRIQESKPVSPELRELFWSQAMRGYTDEVSLDGIRKRWSHLVRLPMPEELPSPAVQKIFSDQEELRKKAVDSLNVGKV